MPNNEFILFILIFLEISELKETLFTIPIFWHFALEYQFD